MAEDEGTVRDDVILVHGLLLGAYPMRPLARRLSGCGFKCHLFSYPSLSGSLAEHADALHRYAAALASPMLHYVCHSLGGLVVCHMLARHPVQRPGRILTLGTPHRGSYVARRLARVPGLRTLVAPSLEGGLAGGAPEWPRDREVASIAGSARLGVGRLVPGLPRPNDGTVTVAETRLPGDRPHAVLPVTHTTMLLSPQVAEYACAYLETGEFPRSPSLRGPSRC